jgi:NAD(P)-dependent dehydrogenase (short-subunit alcohol dehydrogenase family)
MPTVLVTGAGRGIGLEFARQYAAHNWQVIATVRDEAGARALRSLERVRIEQLDMRDRSALAGFGDRLGGEPLDLFIANAGVTSPGSMGTAEEAKRFVEVLEVNTVAPTLLASVVVPNVVAARGKLVAMSSGMASIADNRSGGWLAYRASKAALNAAWRTLAVDLEREPIAIATFDPGWVQTDMGGPNAKLSPEESVAALRGVIDRLGPRDKGVYLNLRGETLPW